MKKQLLIILAILAQSGLTWAGEVDVENVRVSRNPDQSYTFDVTLQHSDQGLEHYADRWDVLDESGNVLASRVLQHPHVHEQPFTRSLYGVTIPSTVTKVIIRGHDSVHGYGGQNFTVILP